MKKAISLSMRTGRVSRTAVLAALLAMTLGLSACGGGESAPASAEATASEEATASTAEEATGDGQMHLTVGNVPISDAAPMFVAQDLGYFEEEGLDVEVKFMEGGAVIAPAVESGSLDLGMSNVGSILQATARGLPLRCFAGALRKPAEGEALSIMASPKETINSPADLEGKTFAVSTLATITQIVAEAWLKDHGVDPASVKFTAVPYPDIPAALTSGQVAAAMVEQPFIAIAKSEGATVLEEAPSEVIAHEPMFTCWFSSVNWISNNKQAAEAYIRAIDKAIEYINTHREETNEIILKHTKVPPEYVSDLALPIFTTEISPSDLEPWVKSGVEFGIIPEVDPAEAIQTP